MELCNKDQTIARFRYEWKAKKQNGEKQKR